MVNCRPVVRELARPAHGRGLRLPEFSQLFKSNVPVSLRKWSMEICARVRVPLRPFIQVSQLLRRIPRLSRAFRSPSRPSTRARRVRRGERREWHDERLRPTIRSSPAARSSHTHTPPHDPRTPASKPVPLSAFRYGSRRVSTAIGTHIHSHTIIGPVQQTHILELHAQAPIPYHPCPPASSRSHIKSPSRIFTHEVCVHRLRPYLHPPYSSLHTQAYSPGRAPTAPRISASARALSQAKPEAEAFRPPRSTPLAGSWARVQGTTTRREREATAGTTRIRRSHQGRDRGTSRDSTAPTPAQQGRRFPISRTQSAPVYRASEAWSPALHQHQPAAPL